MNILYTLTRNYYPYLKWSIDSLLEHNKNVKLYILAEDDELPYDIPCSHRIINMSGQKYFPPEGPNMNSQFTYMAMLRVCVPQILKVNKVICLDVDTIICDSLEPIWETDLEGKWLAWCPERFGFYRPFGEMYYNAGVMMMNLKQMRQDHVTETAVEMLNQERFPYTDQCVLNKLAVPDKCVDLDMRYNESFCCGRTDNPAIVHYAGRPDWYESRNMFRWEYRDKFAQR